MIKTIFFDFDGVLTVDNSGSYTTCTSIQKHVPDTAFDHILKCYRVHQPKLLLGQTTHVAIWDEFCECVGKRLDFQVLEEAYRSTRLNEKMVQLCNDLKGQYKLGIITDNSKERFHQLKAEMKFLEIFEIVLVSGEIGIRKDVDETFVQALDLAACLPEECVFIDNNESNLVVPRKLHWNTIFHDDKKNDVDFLLKELAKLAVSLDPTAGMR